MFKYYSEYFFKKSVFWKLNIFWRDISQLLFFFLYHCPLCFLLYVFSCRYVFTDFVLAGNNKMFHSNIVEMLKNNLLWNLKIGKICQKFLRHNTEICVLSPFRLIQLYLLIQITAHFLKSSQRMLVYLLIQSWVYT